MAFKPAVQTSLSGNHSPSSVGLADVPPSRAVAALAAAFESGERYADVRSVVVSALPTGEDAADFIVMARTASRFFRSTPKPRSAAVVSLADEVRALLNELRSGRSPRTPREDTDDEIEAVECSICLDACIDPSTLRGCHATSHHTFCLSCITRWAEVTTRCPLCTLPFDAIVHPSGAHIDVQARSPSSLRALADSEEVVGVDRHGNVMTAREYIERIDATMCSGCGGAGDDSSPGMSDAETLLCDECDDAWHMACLPTPTSTIPEGDWMCPTCDVLDLPISDDVQEDDDVEEDAVELETIKEREEDDEDVKENELESETPPAKRSRTRDILDLDSFRFEP